ncbi:hypothetical protein O6H91_18G008000 [Diphasiastrum complanatum]|uniref:Uncharacterized protein n=2 Tax=Diphasiastrum complanatum TaxID=34168 RepID=A0ACC2AXU9_DIPCM|nr:hypothetical protein O6H91_Y036100 [Diphasiastrum complanatum]KAJ7522357.1 hypothetical protein O6H91_18G008000 [Diphasiastrum complanatum]
MAAEGGLGEEFRCFVGGLAWATDDGRLEDAFKPYGQVIESKVVNDRETGRSRGFGFVTFSNEKSMKDAIQSLNGSELDGRNITVNQAQSRGNSGGGGNYRSGNSGGGYNNSGSRYGGSGGGYGNGRSGSDDRGSDRGYGASRNSGYGSRGGSYGGNRGDGGGANSKSWRSSRNEEY